MLSLSDYRWQCLYCLLFNVTLGSLLGGRIWTWQHDLEIKIEKLDFKTNYFCEEQTTYLIIIIKKHPECWFSGDKRARAINFPSVSRFTVPRMHTTSGESDRHLGLEREIPAASQHTEVLSAPGLPCLCRDCRCIWLCCVCLSVISCHWDRTSDNHSNLSC